MGPLTTYLVARYAAKRQLRKLERRVAVEPGLPEFNCSSCGEPLVLSIHWPGIDPVYWEDHLGGICTNCFDS